MALNAKDLIKNKKLIDDKKNKNIEMEVPDLGTFVFRLPTIEDYEDSEAYAKSRKNEFLSNNYMIYNCCLEPNLKDPELHKAYDVKDPVDIVDKIFLIGEVGTIASHLVEKAGFDMEMITVSDKLKN